MYMGDVQSDHNTFCTTKCTTKSTHGNPDLPRNGMPKVEYHGSKFAIPASRSGSFLSLVYGKTTLRKQ
jgi:hypothetical protein